jgi:hypothetical protein
MVALETTAWLGSIAALGGVAGILIGAGLFSRLRRALEPEASGTRHSGAGRTAALEMIASLAAAAGLLGTFLALKADGGRLIPIFSPVLAGMVVFVFCQGAAGLLRSWTDAPPRTPIPAAATPPPSPSPSVPRRPKRLPTPPPPVSRMDVVARGLLMFACLLGSILVHGAVFFIALRVHAGATPPKEPERSGIYAASLVRLPTPPPEVVKKEEPPPEPPKPELPKPEPPKEEAKPEPKAEASEPVAAAEPVKAEAPAAPPPPPPPPAAEASAPAEPAKPAAPPPPSRPTEASEPAGAAPPAEPAAGPPPKAGVDPSVLGFGEPPKTKEKTESTAGSDPRGTPTGIATLKDYRKFLAREMKPGSPDGAYVPHLRFGDNTPDQNREITRYFGMELIAYPKNQKFYVYISPDQDLYSRSNDFSYIHNFSSRAIFRSSPYFDGLRAEAAKRVGVSADSLVLAQLLKPSSAAYIGWKEAECARRAGVALDTVDACDATFAKTSFGVWIVRIDRLVLKDGRTLPVEDFEWARIGGDR